MRKSASLYGAFGALLIVGCGSTAGSPVGTGAQDAPSGIASRLEAPMEAETLMLRGLLPGADLTKDAYSGNGNFITFCSSDGSLVDGDTNGQSDVFRYSRNGNSFLRCSLSASGNEANGPCWRASASADGRYVVFDSTANNLVDGDVNNRGDVFRKDLETGAVEMVTPGSNGASDQAVVSDNGRYVAFRSNATNLTAGDSNRVADIFLRDMQSGTTVRVTAGANRASANPSISGDGRYLSFDTPSTSLTDSQGGQPTSGRNHVWLRDIQGGFTWISRKPDGSEGSSQSQAGHLSRDGNLIGFVSTSGDLSSVAAPGEQIYTRARGAGPCQLLSQNAGTPANGSCRSPVLSQDGEWVSYLSSATNLVNGKTDSQLDVFRTNRLSGLTTRLSNPNGANDNHCEQVAQSRDGGESLFRTLASTLVTGDTDNDDDLFTSGFFHLSRFWALSRVDISNSGESGNNDGDGYPSLSTNGNQIVFSSFASNLVPGDTNGGGEDCFVYERGESSIRRISVGPGGAQGNSDSQAPHVSASGQFAVFQSYATNLVAGDTNGTADIFCVELASNQVTRVSLGQSGTEGNQVSESPRVSETGRDVVFASFANNLVAGDTNGRYDIFVRDRLADTTARVSLNTAGQEGNNNSYRPSMSNGSTFVAFESRADNFVAGDSNGSYDIFVRDRQTAVTSRVSVSSAGQQANGDSQQAVISASGRYVAFQSVATNLVPGDSNSAYDVFLHDRQTGATERISVGYQGQANNSSSSPDISADGRYVVFHSNASNLVPGDTNGSSDVFVHDRATGNTTLLSSVGNSIWPALSPDGSYAGFRSAGHHMMIKLAP